MDIASDMLRLAYEFNRHGPRCSYRLNTTNDLQLFSDDYFDFIYSNIVLQHMKPEYAANYIREFVRVLAPGGLIVFQLPSEILKPNLSNRETRLEDTAFRASIRPVAVVHTMEPCSEAEIAVVVKNVSNFTWPRSSVNLGNHWLTESGARVVIDDARAQLSKDLPPGNEEQVTLRVTAPEEPGAYQMELDMVEEGVAWFKQRGSETAIFPVSVRLERLDGVKPATFKARMEMYGMPLEAVVGIVTQSGGRFVEIRQDTSGGAHWQSYRYCITKNEGVSGETPDRYYFRDYKVRLNK